MGAFDSLWNIIKGNVKKIGLEKADSIRKTITNKGEQLVDKGAAWIKEQTPDTIDGFIDQAASKGKEMIDETAIKAEKMAQDKLQK